MVTRLAAWTIMSLRNEIFLYALLGLVLFLSHRERTVTANEGFSAIHRGIVARFETEVVRGKVRETGR